MCGIVGYTGMRPAVPFLMNGLRRLEYRGYDSAGVALQAGEGLLLEKQEGKVQGLADALAERASVDLDGSVCGIAHTRWATHGPPTQNNAHPHLSKERIALVHNGIIENHNSLRERLRADGYEFLSETDTEVLAHLVESHYEGDLLVALTAALKEVQGTFGVACISAEEPGVLIVARRGSPIVIGLGEDETIVASDASAIIKHTRQVIYLDDNDVARIVAGDVEIRTLDSTPVSRATSEIDWSADAAGEGWIRALHAQGNL